MVGRKNVMRGFFIRCCIAEIRAFFRKKSKKIEKNRIFSGPRKQIQKSAQYITGVFHSSFKAWKGFVYRLSGSGETRSKRPKSGNLLSKKSDFFNFPQIFPSMTQLFFALLPACDRSGSNDTLVAPVGPVMAENGPH